MNHTLALVNDLLPSLSCLPLFKLSPIFCFFLSPSVSCREEREVRKKSQLSQALDNNNNDNNNNYNHHANQKMSRIEEVDI